MLNHNLIDLIKRETYKLRYEDVLKEINKLEHDYYNDCGGDVHEIYFESNLKYSKSVKYEDNEIITSIYTDVDQIDFEMTIKFNFRFDFDSFDDVLMPADWIEYDMSTAKLKIDIDCGNFCDKEECKTCKDYEKLDYKTACDIKDDFIKRLI